MKIRHINRTGANRLGGPSGDNDIRSGSVDIDGNDNFLADVGLDSRAL